MKAPITQAQAWAWISESAGWDVATKLEQSQAERIAELERESETHSKAYGLAIVERDNLRHELKVAQEGWRCECSTDDACRFARERDAKAERITELETEVLSWKICNDRTSDAAKDLSTQLAATAPVAKLKPCKEGWFIDLDNPPPLTGETIELFTRPMPAQDVTELVEALERVLNCCDIAECSTVPNSPGALKNARTALSKYKGAK